VQIQNDEIHQPVNQYGLQTIFRIRDYSQERVTFTLIAPVRARNTDCVAQPDFLRRGNSHVLSQVAYHEPLRGNAAELIFGEQSWLGGRRDFFSRISPGMKT